MSPVKEGEESREGIEEFFAFYLRDFVGDRAVSRVAKHHQNHERIEVIRGEGSLDNREVAFHEFGDLSLDGFCIERLMGYLRKRGQVSLAEGVNTLERVDVLNVDPFVRDELLDSSVDFLREFDALMGDLEGLLEIFHGDTRRHV